jgi:O-antigen/teichoic acid export membrane protein
MRETITQWTDHTRATLVNIFSGKDSLLVNSIFLFGILIASSAFGFLVWTVATRFYVPDDVGLATVVISTSQLLTGLSGLGLGMGLIKFLPACDRPVRMINTALLFTIAAAFVASLVYLLGARFWSPSLAFLTARREYFLGFVLCGPIFGANSLIQMVFQSFRQSKYGFWLVVLTNTLRILLTILLVRWGAVGLIVAVVAAMLPAVLVGLLRLLPKVLPGYAFGVVWETPHLKQLIPFSFGVHLSLQVYQVPLMLTPLLVMERMGSAASANAYIAWMLGALIFSAGQAIAGSAYAEGSNELHNFRHVFRRALRLGFLVTCALGLVLVLTAPWVLGIFGEAYQAALPLLLWMAFAAPFVSLNKVFFTGMQVRHELKGLISLSILSTFVFLVVFMVLADRWGLNTVGIGWFLSQVVVFIFCFGDYRKKLASV